MLSLTKKERELLIILFKDFNSYYNANSISKILGISRVGAQKIFKRLLKENLVKDKKIGKSIIYNINLEDDYARELISFLLVDESNKFKRWKEEFKALFKKDRVVMIYGSILKNYDKARDIDIMVILKKEDFKEVRDLIKEKQNILPKKIHSVELTADDFTNNIKQKQEAIIDIIKNAIILYGQGKYVEIIKNVTSI